MSAKRREVDDWHLEVLPSSSPTRGSRTLGSASHYLDRDVRYDGCGSGGGILGLVTMGLALVGPIVEFNSRPWGRFPENLPH